MTMENMFYLRADGVNYPVGLLHIYLDRELDDVILTSEQQKINLSLVILEKYCEIFHFNKPFQKQYTQ